MLKGPGEPVSHWDGFFIPRFRFLSVAFLSFQQLSSNENRRSQIIRVTISNTNQQTWHDLRGSIWRKTSPQKRNISLMSVRRACDGTHMCIWPSARFLWPLTSHKCTQERPARLILDKIWLETCSRTLSVLQWRPCTLRIPSHRLHQQDKALHDGCQVCWPGEWVLSTIAFIPQQCFNSKCYWFSCPALRCNADVCIFWGSDHPLSKHSHLSTTQSSISGVSESPYQALLDAPSVRSSPLNLLWQPRDVRQGVGLEASNCISGLMGQRNCCTHTKFLRTEH